MRALVFALALIASCFGAFAQDAPSTFTHPGVAKDAQRYESWLKTNYGQPIPKKNPQAKSAADKVVATGQGDMRGAARTMASAVTADPDDSDGWIGLARALLAITPDPNKGSERYELPLNASGAAYIAVQRAKSAPVRARALAVLGESLKRRSYWRPAIDALKASLALVDTPDVRSAFEALRNEHGFRMTNYEVESDMAEPRLCMQFSEGLQRGQVDFSKFISVDGHDPQNVNAEGSQLCVEGLQHGKRYEVLLRAGLPSDVGEALGKSSEIGVYVKDRGASVRFTGRAYVLPSRGQQGIPVVTVNAEAVNVEIYRIGDRSLVSAINSGDLSRQLSGYETQQMKETSGQKVWGGALDTQRGKLNEEVTTAIPVGDAIPQLQPGVYAMTAWPQTKQKGSDYQSRATQWFIVSDLGLTAFTGDTGVHAFVRSLATADAVRDVTVKLVAKNNEVLAQAKSDANGYVRFDQGLAKGEGGLSPAVLVAEGSGDYAFLDMTTAAFDLSDRGVKGRETAGALDGFLFAERGVYRPGETVSLTALVRDKAGKASDVPMTLIVQRPDGVEHKRIALTSAELGGHATKLALAASAMTGTWKVRLHSDPKADALSTLSFLVEDFQPERLDMTLSAAGPTIAPEETQTITVAGRYLYGPPAANLAIEADVVVKASGRDLDGLDGYQFGQAGEKISPVRKSLEQLPTTDGKGAAAITVALPAIPQTTKPLDADVLVKLREPGGRTIERTFTLAVDPRAPRLGIKPTFTGTLGEGETALFDVVVLDASGKRAASKGVAWTLYRLDQSWQWYNRDGSWTYDSVTLTKKVNAGTLDVGADQPGKVSTPNLPWGRYRLEVASTEAGGPLSSVIFASGWYGGEAADTPEMLDVALDKPSYKAGDTAKLKIATRTGGKALVTVLSGGLLAHKLVDVPRGGGEIPVEVGATWGSGAYVTAMLYRATDEAQKRMPGRAVGLKWLAIDQASRTLKISLSTPQKVKSGGTLTVPVKVDGLAAGEQARVTLAAVDVGILNLTRYQTPNPENWFYAQTRLGAEIRDLYGRLIDGMRAERGRLRSGGDAAGGMAMQGTPPVDAIVALTSGIIKTDADGRASVDFAMPDFNGTVRVMAVAWSAGQLGHAQSEVIVRDPVALTASLPRFLTLGDEARLSVDVHNVEGAAGSYKIAIKQDGGGVSSMLPDRTVALDKEQRKSEAFTLKPIDVGLYTWDVSVTGPGGIDVKRHLTLDVKAPAGDVKRVRVSKLGGNGGKLTLSSDLLADLIPSKTQINVSVGPLASLDVPGLLTQLDRYPYGCAEQTTSRALPLLYANQLAVQVGMAKDNDLRDRIQGAVDRVLEMQDSSGAFGIWGPRNVDLWLTAYVMDFLTRAKEGGFTVKPLAYSQGLDRLANFIAYAQDFEAGGEDRAYALYVLARNGRAPAGELRYYVDTRLDRFSTTLGKAQLGAALAMMGDKERAEKAFASAIGDVQKKDKQGWRNDYGSSLRDGAALVALTSEAKIGQRETPQLVNVLAKTFSERTYTSTQEQAWMLLAARALSEQAKDTKLGVNGETQTGSLNRRLSPAELKDGVVTITNLGDAQVDAVVSVIGVALTPEPAVSKGFTIERSYYTLDGQKVDLKSGSGGTSQLKQTDRLVTVLKIESTEQGGRVLLVDHLPAGLEIENPRLVDGGDIKTLAWLKPTIRPEHTEFRDDRFVAAFNLSGKSTSRSSDDDDDDDSDSSANAPKGPVSSATVAYIVRAVTPGSFVHPAATVEDMYRPERFARTAAGRLEVQEK